MILLLLTTVVASLTAWVYMRWIRVKSFWAERGVPHLPPHPIYGSLTFLQKINPALWMRQVYDQFQSPYVGIWLFWRPALVINCPKIGHKILVKNSANFRNRFLSSAPHDAPGFFNIFTTNEPLWSSVRRRLTPAFTSSKLKGIQLLMNAKAKELVERFAIESKKGRFNYKTVCVDFTSDVIGTVSLGVKCDATLTGNSPVREITKDFEEFSLLRGMAWSCIFFFPELVGPLRFRFFPKAATDKLSKIYYTVVQQRKAELKDKQEPRDLLDILMAMKKDISLESTDSDEILISQAAIIIQAGYETSGSQLTFLLYEVAHHPEIQAKLYDELKDAKERNGGADFDESTLANLTYLNCVVNESLRKYPPMGWLDRISLNEYKIDDNLTIAAGTPLYVNAIGMHYDPTYFPDPTRFNPDRFLPENLGNMTKFAFMPFGDGPRSCIGKRFAYMSVRTGISTVVLNYEVKPVPNTPKPTELQIEKNGLLMSPGEKMYLEFVPRNKS